MTYGYQPDNWPAFESELRRHGVEVTDIERVEFRPAGDAPAGTFDVTVTLRSGLRGIQRVTPGRQSAPVWASSTCGSVSRQG
jgi:hypothetical protein